MNLLLSLFILNPLEALVIILGCDLFSNRKFVIRNDIKHCYILGTINLIIQIILNHINASLLSLIVNYYNAVYCTNNY